MRFLFLVILGFLLNQTMHAQLTSKFEFFAGYGYYEGYNIGSEYYFKSGLRSLSLSAGYDYLFNKEQKSFSMELGYNRVIYKNYKNEEQQYKWHLSNRVVVWQLEDKYYVWRAITLIPSLQRRFIIYKKINLSFDIGPAFNIVLYNKRKTSEGVGWPYHVMPNFRIICIL
jgi:hypothetical protein